MRGKSTDLTQANLEAYNLLEEQAQLLGSKSLEKFFSVRRGSDKCELEQFRPQDGRSWVDEEQLLWTIQLLNCLHAAIRNYTNGIVVDKKMAIQFYSAAKKIMSVSISNSLTGEQLDFQYRQMSQSAALISEAFNKTRTPETYQEVLEYNLFAIAYLDQLRNPTIDEIYNKAHYRSIAAEIYNNQDRFQDANLELTIALDTLSTLPEFEKTSKKYQKKVKKYRSDQAAVLQHHMTASPSTPQDAKKKRQPGSKSSAKKRPSSYTVVLQPLKFQRAENDKQPRQELSADNEQPTYQELPTHQEYPSHQPISSNNPLEKINSQVYQFLEKYSQSLGNKSLQSFFSERLSLSLTGKKIKLAQFRPAETEDWLGDLSERKEAQIARIELRAGELLAGLQIAISTYSSAGLALCQDEKVDSGKAWAEVKEVLSACFQSATELTKQIETPNKKDHLYRNLAQSANILSVFLKNNSGQEHENAAALFSAAGSSVSSGSAANFSSSSSRPLEIPTHSNSSSGGLGNNTNSPRSEASTEEEDWEIVVSDDQSVLEDDQPVLEHEEKWLEVTAGRTVSGSPTQVTAMEYDDTDPKSSSLSAGLFTRPHPTTSTLSGDSPALTS